MSPSPVPPFTLPTRYGAPTEVLQGGEGAADSSPPMTPRHQYFFIGIVIGASNRRSGSRCFFHVMWVSHVDERIRYYPFAQIFERIDATPQPIRLSAAALDGSR